MTLALEAAMPKKPSTPPPEPIGPIIEENLIRLGYARTVVTVSEVAEKVSQKTGKTMSRQHLMNILNAVRVTDATVERLAKGLGVKPDELTKRHKK